MMRFYEFRMDDDLATTLDVKSKQLDNQAATIKNRKKALSNLKRQKANRDELKKMTDHGIDAK